MNTPSQTIIRAKLTAPLTIRNGNSKAVKSYDAEWAKSLTIMQVMSAKTVIDVEFKSREEERKAEKAKISEQIAALQKAATTLED